MGRQTDTQQQLIPTLIHQNAEFKKLQIKQCFDAVGWVQEGHQPVKTEWWDAGTVICLW